MRGIGRSRREGDEAPDSQDEPTERRRGRRSREAAPRVSKGIEALKEGGRETRAQLEGKPSSLLDRLESGLAAVLPIFGDLFAGIARVLRGIGDRLAGPLGGIGSALDGALAGLGRVVTPMRATLVAAIGCAVLLALSQFADYRGIAVGVDSFAEGVDLVAPPPDVDRAETGSAHGYLMIPAAIVAVIALALAARSGRWQLCRLAALIGLAAVAVTLLIDRPAGLDEGTIAQDFAGAEARLLGGWWAQLFAGIGLLATSLLLATEMRRERGGARPRPRPRPSAGAVDAPAGGVA